MNSIREQPKVLLVHPGRQHSFRLAKALKQAGLLYKYMTTVYKKENARLYQLLEKVLSDDNRRRLQGRRCAALEDAEVVQFDELTGLLLLLVYRLDSGGKWAKKLEEALSASFQRKAAQYAIAHEVDAVITFDTNAAICFELLQRQAPQIKRIMDSAHPARNYVSKIFHDKLDSAGAFAKTYGKCEFFQERDTDKYYREVISAQYHIVASSFAKDAVSYCGIPEENIFVVPYGVEVGRFPAADKQYDTLKVLYVGEISQRKGIAQVLEAAKQLAGSNVEFHLVGGGREDYPELYAPYEQYVHFHGRMLFEELVKHFEAASLFVFPSMGDGFGLVILEAMAAGLPVICSANCAGPDVVADGCNGFVIEAGNTAALIEKIMWFNEHKALIPAMSRNARATALAFTWERYERKAADSVAAILAR